mmetsp:Transcript_41177/g.73837  ORF Transcript_41177/g.73837 Transcript_41177/m.73837 type:complete len:96 (+) Transcript_41177:373-660(+)
MGTFHFLQLYNLTTTFTHLRPHHPTLLTLFSGKAQRQYPSTCTQTSASHSLIFIDSSLLFHNGYTNFLYSTLISLYLFGGIQFLLKDFGLEQNFR